MEISMILSLGEKIKDPRKSGMITYSVQLILFITVAAVMSGAETWNEVAAFGKSRIEFIRKFFPDIEDTPSHDTFNRFFSILKPKVFETAFRKWIAEYFPKPQGTLSIDGKSMKGAARNDPKLKDSKDPSPIDMVSIWSKQYGISFGQLKVSDKSNEMTAIPKLVKGMDLKGCLVTIDAIACQKKIADAILECEGDFLLACKTNQRYLNETARNLFEQQAENLKANPDLQEWYHSSTTENKGHGRIERREVTAVGQPGGGEYFEKNLSAPQPWKGINAFVKVHSTRTVIATGETTTEDRYFLTSLVADQVEKIAQAIRDHWCIENQLHWQLDVSFDEDDSRKIKNAALNFSLVNKIVLSIIKRYKDVSKSKSSVKGLRKQAGWDEKTLMDVFEKAVWVNNPMNQDS